MFKLPCNSPIFLAIYYTITKKQGGKKKMPFGCVNVTQYVELLKATSRKYVELLKAISRKYVELLAAGTYNIYRHLGESL